jgi:PAS domain S-box-containing protein
MVIHFDGLDVGGPGNLTDILESSPDCIKVLSADGRIRSINSAGSAFIGRPCDQLVGRVWSEFLPKALRAEAQGAVRGAFAGETLRLSTPCFTTLGTRHCDLTVSPLRDQDRTVVAVLASTRDVTDLVEGRLAAEGIARSLARQSAAMRAAGLVAKLGAWEIDYQHQTIFWSQEIWSLTGLAPRPLRLDEIAAALGGDRADKLGTALLACRQTGAAFALDAPVVRDDQTRVWLRIFAERDVSADILRGAVQDVTDQRAAQAELVEARDAAQAASAAQAAFLANVSHEIRTPLHGILGMAQVMDHETPTPLQRERLAVIRQSGDTLMALLNDILDLSKIEAGRLELRVRVFPLDAALTAACAPFVYLAAQRDLTLDVEVVSEARGFWRGDELRLRQIIANLVSNALKFTRSGGVVVMAHLRSTGLCVAVSDTGLGIYPADVPKLFDKFTQGRASGGVLGGTGLGLAICRELAQLMGGDLTVQTVLGQGSTFEVCVPFERAQADMPVPPLAANPPRTRPLRILAAEDNPTNQLILRSMLAPLSVDLLVVNDGAEAVEAVQGGVFDLVLMDIQMPRLNGIQAVQLIRAWEADGQRVRTPIVALSANVMAHQVQTYKDAGMDEAVEKPIDLTRLYAVVEAIIHRSEGFAI